MLMTQDSVAHAALEVTPDRSYLDRQIYALNF